MGVQTHGAAHGLEKGGPEDAQNDHQGGGRAEGGHQGDEIGGVDDGGHRGEHPGDGNQKATQPGTPPRQHAQQGTQREGDAETDSQQGQGGADAPEHQRPLVGKDLEHRLGSGHQDGVGLAQHRGPQLPDVEQQKQKGADVPGGTGMFLPDDMPQAGRLHQDGGAQEQERGGGLVFARQGHLDHQQHKEQMDQHNGPGCFISCLHSVSPTASPYW